MQQFIAAVTFAIFAAASARAEEPALPPAVARQVDFHKDILPILANSCARCHAGGKRKGGFAIDTRASLMQGGESGPAVVVGNSAASRLVALVAGLEPEVIMPAQGPRLSSDQVGILRGWIDQGLPWEDGFSFKKIASVPWEPRRVELPPAPDGSSLTNPIDRLLAPYFASQGFRPPSTVDERTFLRRAYLDLVGLLPTPEVAEAFLSDVSPVKRARVVQQLLAARRNYAIHWLSFWNDALRNDYRGTGYIDGGRLQITDWLAKSLVENVPYDEFVRQLINPAPESAGFVKGIVWRGVVNASQVPAMQAAQNISQVFLGINLKCASCHDSFVSDWKLTDAYGLAGIFAEGPLEIHRCDQPTGKFAPPQFLNSRLGTIDGGAALPERLRQLAQVLTQPENGRLARTVVNRLWSRLLGRGLIEPVDEMDAPPWSADLLDYLAVDLVDHGFDLKHTLELIATSQAYQLPAMNLVEPASESFIFRGPAVRRMTAEQFVDAVSDLVGIEYAAAAVKPAALAGEDDGRVIVRSGGPRAALLNADPLMLALGRSNREQVVTQRPNRVTTLEALELTNGSGLATLLEKGALMWSAKSPQPEQLVDQLYRRALLRSPTEEERELALQLLGTSAAPAEVEDLLWSIVMLPEFQLIP